jgi:flagellar protein FliS
VAPTTRETYFENEVLTAPPQKRHLMLIEGALRYCYAAFDCWKKQQEEPRAALLVRAQQIMVAMITGLKYDRTPELIRQVARVYVFIYRSIVEAHVNHDPQKLADAIRVLHIERETWQQVCRQLAGQQPTGMPLTTVDEPYTRLSLNA